MDFSRLWEMEESFWLDGSKFYENSMASVARMVFPSPVGILEGDQIVEGLREGPRWNSVDFENVSEAHLGDAAVLAYQATGKRNGDDPYSALCSSVYVRRNGNWVLLAHQQTPTG